CGSAYAAPKKVSDASTQARQPDLIQKLIEDLRGQNQSAQGLIGALRAQVEALKAQNDRVASTSPATPIQSIQDLRKKIGDFMKGENSNAARLAMSIDGLHDPNGQACWTDFAKAGEIFDKITVSQQPTDQPAAGEQKQTTEGLATDVEQVRLL